MNISGKWQGILNYGKEYKKFAGKEIAFEMTIQHKGTIIEGRSIDLSGFGSNSDPATIIGSFADEQITFEKQYPSTLRLSYWNKKFKKDKGKKSPIINYKGNFNQETNSFSGIWEIKETFWILGIFKKDIKATGTWKMKKAGTKK